MTLDGQFNARIHRLEKMVENMPSGSEVPQPSVADYGKVIGVDENGEYSLENVPQEVPTPTEIDAGKVVKVNASGTGYELEDFPQEVPTPSVNDEGKVLVVDSSGTEYVLSEQLIKKGSGKNSIIQTHPDSTDDNSIASADFAIAIGVTSVANGIASIAGGQKVAGINNTANGACSIAYGKGCVANGNNSQALGQASEATGLCSHSHGNATIANGRVQTVIGQANVVDNETTEGHGTGAGKYLFIIGNGTNSSSRSNALTVDWDGNIVCNNIPAPPANNGTYSLKCTVTNDSVTYAWVVDT